MTIKKIIEAVDLAKPNDLETALKVQWIAELDGKIAADVFLMGYSELAQFRYTHPEDLEKEPLVSFPHDDIYRLWLMAKIDLANGEYNRYQNTMIAYNESYGNFVRWFARVWRPAQGECGCFTIRDDVPQYYITAYGLAVRAGFTGSLEEWFVSLKGEKGDPGKGPYEFAVDGGFVGTEEEFLYKLLHDGKTAWEYAVEGGYKGTEEDFVALLANVPAIDESFTKKGFAADAAATGEAFEKIEMRLEDIPLIDATLSEAGQAADAAETGAAIKKVEDRLHFIRLWQNKDELQPFSDQQIVLEEAKDYSLLMFRFRHSTFGHITQYMLRNTGAIIAYYPKIFIMNNEIAEAYRYARREGDLVTITFSCGMMDGLENPMGAIPVDIYGCKI